MTLEEFCDTVTLSLHSSLVDTQNAKKAYESDSCFKFGLSDFEPKSPKEKALSKLSDIVFLFTEEHKFDLDDLVDLHHLILDIKEAE